MKSIKIKNIMALLMIILLIISLSPIVTNASASWYNQSWAYRKILTLTGKQIGDQTKIIIANNTATVYNVSCNGHVMGNFRDLFFTDGSNNPIPFWIQNYTTGVKATVWINNSVNDTNLYMYYGNHAATSSSNGNTTFWFFDDFNGSSYNTHKWTKVGTPTLTYANSQLNMTTSASNQYLSSIPSFGRHYEIICYMHEYVPTGPAPTGANGVGFYLVQSTLNAACFAATSTGSSSLFIDCANGTGHTVSPSYYNIGTNYFNEIYRYSGRCIWIRNSVKILNTTSYNPSTNLNADIGQGSYYSRGQSIYEWIFVKKLWDIEPYWSSFSAEQQVAPLNSNPSPANYPAYPVNGCIVVSSPVISITISSLNGYYMNQSIRTNQSGSWVTLSAVTHVLNSTQLYTSTWFNGNKSCYWSSNITDNHSHWTNNTYSYYQVHVPSTNMTIHNHHVNTTWSLQIYHTYNYGFTEYDNDTGNTTIKLPWHVIVTLNGVIGFINWTGSYNSSFPNIGFDVTKNMSIVCNANASRNDSWLYLEGFDINEPFLLLSLFYVLFYFWWKSESMAWMYILTMMIIPYIIVVMVVYLFPIYITNASILLFIRILFLLLSVGIGGYTLDRRGKSKKSKT